MKNDETFEDLVTFCELNGKNITEVVKKRGDSWVVFDDKTKTQKGVFKDREAAWNKQKQLRAASKSANKSKKASGKAKKAQKAHTAPKPHVAPKAKTAPKAKKEHLLHMFKESVRRVLQEGSALSYVFDQDPVSKSSVVWDQILQQVSKEALLSDARLSSILHKTAKAEVEALGKAFLATRRVLQTDDFSVEKGEVDQDEDGNLIMDITISSEELEDLPLFIKIENGKPLLIIPEELEASLDASPSEEIRKLKAFLMFVQEDELDKIEDVSKLIEERDEYLQELLIHCSEVLKKLDPLKLSFVRFLLKTKYRGK
jgi:hypothetical protein